MTKRLSLCYAAPGHALLSTAGPTRNILSLAEALGQWADVTVAFHSCCETIAAKNFRVMTIEPAGARAREARDDVAARGLNPVSHVAYLRTLYAFARQQAQAFDVILEKGWRLSGLLLAAFRRYGVPGALVENDVRFWGEPLTSGRAIARYGLHSLAQGVAGFVSRRAARVIAETEELRTLLIQQRRIAPERLKVIGLGVNHALFRPQEQLRARQVLGIDPEVCMLLYVGGMDINHDLGPVLEALEQTSGRGLALHIVGDGEYRVHYEAKAVQVATPVHFHGQRPHGLVPTYIAAADLCLAPYNVQAFPQGLVPFSTLKIPEYMACGRPVVSVPSGHIGKLITDRVSGFLFPNDVSSWRTFLDALPSRVQLQDMGRVAAQVAASISWERTALEYLDVCQKLVVV